MAIRREQNSRNRAQRFTNTLQGHYPSLRSYISMLDKDPSSVIRSVRLFLQVGISGYDLRVIFFDNFNASLHQPCAADRLRLGCLLTKQLGAHTKQPTQRLLAGCRLLQRLQPNLVGRQTATAVARLPQLHSHRHQCLSLALGVT